MGRALAAAVLLTLALAAPAAAAVRHVVLGRSPEGRAIRAIRIGDTDSPRKALVVGSIHGDERAGLRVTDALRSLRPAGVDLWVVNSVNPDGLAHGTRQNARGVDLNRNFPWRWRTDGRRGYRYWPGPRPLSEPESRIVRRLVLQLRPSVTIWYHQPWDAVLRPCRGRAPLQRAYARLAGMRTSCRGAGLRGTAATWENHVLPGAGAFVVELPAGGVTARRAARHARAAEAMAIGR
jgi:murein peptide amidase A